MDERHVNIIHNLVMECNFNHVVEIGCYSGFSTVALIESLNKGKLFDLHLVEPHPSQALYAAVSMCKNKERIFLHKKESKNALGDIDKIDLLIIDGDHTMAGVGEDLLHVLKKEIPNIFAHDTNSPNVNAEWGAHCTGAELVGATLSNHKNYMSITDQEYRDGERTERGLFFATSNGECYEKARQVYQELC